MVLQKTDSPRRDGVSMKSERGCTENTLLRINTNTIFVQSGVGYAQMFLGFLRKLTSNEKIVRRGRFSRRVGLEEQCR